MKLLKICFLIFITCTLLNDFSTANLKKSLNNVLESYDADPKCVFNHTEITSKTIKFFPKSDLVYGILVFNEHTDLTVSQLKNVFKNMKSLAGGIRVENSKLASLDFLNLENLMCETYGIFILNNSQLTSATALGSINIYGDDFGNECNIQVKNNKKLDADGLCDIGSLKSLMDLRIKGNLKDCGCQGDEISPKTLSKYQNCTKLFQGFNPNNNIVFGNVKYLSNIKAIRGKINIVDSGFQNLSFFENLETIETYNEVGQDHLFLNLDNNFMMEMLAIPDLKEIVNFAPDGIKLANIQRSNPFFCLTIDELLFFLENQITFLHIKAKICPDTRSIISNLSVCYIMDLRILPDNCNIIIGNVIVTAGDESYFYKLSNVSHLFGTLMMQNTSLESLEVLGNVRYIVILHYSFPMIQLVGNSKLKSTVIFPSIEHIITHGEQVAHIQDNNPDSNFCSIFREPTTENEKYRFRTNFIGGDCGGEKMDIFYREPSSAEQLIAYFVFSTIAFVHYF